MRARARNTVAALAVALTAPATVAAQTDYYNTDAGRPIRIEDAYSIERRAFELQLAPLRVERGRSGEYRWGIEPELAYGVLPRTQLEVGVPLVWVDAGRGTRNTRGMAGIDVSVLYNLNVETTIPAFAIAADVVLPVGSLAPTQAFPTIKGIATKTFPFARFHVNAQYTAGNDGTADAVAGVVDVRSRVAKTPRWLGGLAVDRAFPLHSMLLTAEVYAQGAMTGGSAEWHSSVGTRYQLSPRWAMDVGVGRGLSGNDRAWSFTAGGAIAFGLPWNR